MFFRTEPRIERYVERIPPNTVPFPRRENHANKITATAFNALAIGAISAAFFLPNGRSTSEYVGEVNFEGVEGAVSKIILTITGKTDGGGASLLDALPPGLEPIVPALPFVFVIWGVGLHFVARGFARRQ